MGVLQRLHCHTASARSIKAIIGSDTAAKDFTLHQIIQVLSFVGELERQVVGKRIVPTVTVNCCKCLHLDIKPMGVKKKVSNNMIILIKILRNYETCRASCQQQYYITFVFLQ